MTPPVPDSAVEAVAKARHERWRESYSETEQWSRPWSELSETCRTGVINALKADTDLFESIADALPSLREQFLAEVREKLLGDEVRAVAGEAAYKDFAPEEDFDLLNEVTRISWEGNTAAGIEAALDHSFPTQQEAPR